MNERDQSKPVKLGPLGTAVVGVALVGIGWLFAFVLGAAAMQAGAESEDWPTVEGVVKTSKLVEDRRPRRKNRDRAYAPEIVYAYVVDGREFESNRVNFNAGNEWSENRPAVRRIVDAYPRGQKVEVHYDPNDPGTSVLEPGVNLGIAFLVGIAVIVLGVVVLAGAVYSLAMGSSKA